MEMEKELQDDAEWEPARTMELFIFILNSPYKLDGLMKLISVWNNEKIIHKNKNMYS